MYSANVPRGGNELPPKMPNLVKIVMVQLYGTIGLEDALCHSP
jgi:hypothetical protein